MQEREQTEFNSLTKSYLLEMIKMADDKAKAAFGVSAALLVYLVNTPPDVIIDANTAPNWPHAFAVIIWILAALGFATTSALSFFVLLPRMNTAIKGLTFFASIAEWESPEAYAEEVGRRTRTSLDRNTAMHNFELSNVAVKKYRSLNLSMLIGVFGFGLLIVFLVCRWLFGV